MPAKAKNFLLSCLVLTIFIAAAPAECKQLSADSDPADLRAYIERVNRMERPTAEQLFAQAKVLMWLKEYNRAQAAANRVIRLSPKDGKAYAFRGTLSRLLRKNSAALDDMNRAEQLGYREPQLYEERMLAKLALKDFKGANADAEQCLLHEPNQSEAFFVKGAAACELGRKEEGVKYLTKSIELNPSDADAFYIRGIEFRKMGRMKEAEADLAKAKSLGRD